MTIKEMHIEVSQSSQEVGTSVNRKILPEQIDWFLNKSIVRFVEEAIRPEDKQDVKATDFDEAQIDLDSIRTLVETDRPLTTFNTGVFGVISAPLPSDYLHKLDISVGVYSQNNPSFTEASKTTTVTENVYVLKFVPTTKADKPFYQNFNITLGGQQIVSTADLPTNIQSKDFLYQVIDIVKEKLRGNPSIYWEQYKDHYENNSLLLVSESPMVISMNYDGVVITPTLKTKVVQKSVAGYYGKLSSVRIIRGGQMSEIKGSSFSKTFVNSPIGTINQSILKVYYDHTFIVNGAVLNYIRRPRTVSLILGINCDLPYNVHQKVCDLTVEYIKQTISDPNYQWKLQDNKLRSS